ncbi:hypothetical protein [Rhizobium sp. RAF56]|uniref:hypothetical protein n=1 Tax=Rhizobium sp. RAF56 TaxID=3233062 RepID=UPI003F9D8BA5
MQAEPTEAAIRARAKRLGWRVVKSRRALSADNLGCYQLIDDRNFVVIGCRFNAALEEIADALPPSKRSRLGADMTEELDCSWYFGPYDGSSPCPASSYALAVANIVLFTEVGYVELQTVYRRVRYFALVTVIGARPHLPWTFTRMKAGREASSSLVVPERFHRELEALS